MKQMKAYFLLFMLFWVFLPSAYGQQEPTDSIPFESNDSLFVHRTIGFVAGGGVMLPFIEPNMSSTYTNFEVKPKGSFHVGLSLQFPLKKMALESGLQVHVSRIGLSYTRQSQALTDTFPFSTMLVPIMLSNLDTTKRKGFYVAGGLLPTIDITKKLDRDSRIFGLQRFHLGFGAKLGYRIRGMSALYDLAFFVNYYPLNLLKNTDFNRNTLQYLSLIYTGIQFTIR